MFASSTFMARWTQHDYISYRIQPSATITIVKQCLISLIGTITVCRDTCSHLLFVCPSVKSVTSMVSFSGTAFAKLTLRCLELGLWLDPASLPKSSSRSTPMLGLLELMFTDCVVAAWRCGVYCAESLSLILLREYLSLGSICAQAQISSAMRVRRSGLAPNGVGGAVYVSSFNAKTVG